MLSTQVMDVDGRRLRHARLGSGSPLVLLHGYPENLHAWDDVASRLALHHEVFAFDWPGMGESEPWPGGATPHAQADRLARLLDAWGIPAAHVAGIDMGGQPALVFAVRHAARCLSVIAMNSLVLPEEETSWEIRVLRRHGWNAWILRHLPRIVFARAERTFLVESRRLPVGLRDEFLRSFSRPEVREFIVRMCAGYQGTLDGLPGLYASIRVPALALWGERDAHFPVVHARRLAETIPGCSLAIIPGAGHWMPIERADDVAAAMLGFLGGKA